VKYEKDMSEETIDYDKIASEYARHRRVHPEVLRGLLLTSGVDKTSRVLEVGCGTGNYIIALKSSVGSLCWGIDPSQEMLSKAKARSEIINFQIGKAERLDFSPDFFDLVFSVDVIHHISNRPKFFEEAYRMLRPGGKVCTVTDSEEIIRHRRPSSIYFPETVERELKRYPRITALREIMEGLAFTRITENTVEFAYELREIQAYEDKVFSSLHLIPEDAFRRGIERMKKDLRAGPIPAVSRYLLLWGTKQLR
jgi:ubiquinone/menaquinone biosynthesis C-methylase UbiE